MTSKPSAAPHPDSGGGSRLRHYFANRKAWEIPREALVHKVSQGLRAFPQVVLNSPSTALSLLPPPSPPPAMAFKRKLDFDDDDTMTAAVCGPGPAMSRAYTHARAGAQAAQARPLPVVRRGHGRRHVRRVERGRRALEPARLALDRIGRELRELGTCQPRYAHTPVPPSAALTGRMQSRSARSSPATACSRRRRLSPSASSAAACSARASSTIGARPAPSSAPFSRASSSTNCTQLPKLRMACAAGPGRARTMWSSCEQCGAIAMVDLD
jgi:hypothetical protein